MVSYRSVLICERDNHRLQSVLKRADPKSVELLFDELDTATVVSNDALPNDVVRMNSAVTFRDAHTHAESTVRLVYPEETSHIEKSVSILAPVGAALIGLRVGEVIEWPVPNGKNRTLEVVSVENHHSEPL